MFRLTGRILLGTLIGAAVVVAMLFAFIADLGDSDGIREIG
jgi:hypothetical protein